MKPSRVVAIVGIIVLVCVLIICGLMYTTDQNEADDIMAQYRRNTQRFDHTAVSTIIEEIDSDEGEPAIHTVHVDPGEVTSWLDACVRAHHMMYHAGMVYSTTATGNINGMVVKADCSGYIGVAMYLYGLQADCSAPTSVSLKNNTNLEYLGQISLTDMELGDILVYSNHIEVLAKKNPNADYAVGVYNWGSSSTAEDLYRNDPSGHNADACTQNILVGSNSYKNNSSPEVYRIKGDINTAPQNPPSQSGGSSGGSSGGNNSSTPSGATVLNLPLKINQLQFTNTTLGLSGVTVKSAGCFACSIQMVANYLVSPDKAWGASTVQNNFTLDYFTSGGGVKSTEYLNALTGGNYAIGGDTTITSIDQITNSIDSGMPVFLHFTGNIPNYYTGSTHFMVIYGYDQDGNLYIQDPAGYKIQTMPYSDLYANRSNAYIRLIH